MDLLLQNPMLSQEEIANSLGISRSSVGVHLMNLSKEGYILGRGYVLAELTEKYVVGIGAANIDLMGRSGRPLVAADSNPGQIGMSVGGVTHNICENAARLGLPVRLITAVGDDIYADKIRKECIDADIDTSNFLVVPGFASSTYLSIHDNRGEMALALSDMRVLQELSTDFLKTKDKLLRNAGAIVMDTGLPKEILDYVSRTYGDTVPVFVDPVSTTYSEKLLGDLSHYHTFKPNVQEIEVLSGRKADTQENMIRACRILLDKGLTRVIVSRGQHGSIYMDQNGTLLHAKTKPLEQFANATGAGDAFMGGMLYGTLKGLDTEDMLRFATAMSWLAIQHERTINPTITEKSVWDTVDAVKFQVEKITI